MNRTAVLTTAVLTLAFAACQKSAPPDEAPAEATPAPAKSAATPAQASAPAAATPGATAATAPAPAAPAAPELAPPGVFFLTAPVSFETADGISRLIPGQRLQLVRPGVYTAGARQVTLRDDQVTNDLAFARIVAEDDARAQSAIRQSLAARPTATAAGAPAQARAQAQAQAQAVPQPPTSRAPLGSSLDGGAHDQQRDHKRWHKTIYGGWIYN